MKKILSLGAAAAVLSLTAVAASAAIAPEVTPANPVAGDTIVVEIVANGMTQDGTQFTVEASENLELVEAVKGSVDGAFVEFANNKFAYAGTAPATDGTVLLTLTYNVNAAADEEVSVKLVADEGFTDIDAEPFAAVVVEGTETEQTDVVTSEETTTEDAGLTTTEEETTAEGTADAGDNGNSDNKGNPSTGVALAVVPAVLAGAAIVVAKKRK